MATKLENARAEASKFAKTARDIAEKADTEGRSLTADEKSAFDDAMAKGRRAVEDMRTIKADEEILTQAKALADEIGPEASGDVDAQRNDQKALKFAKALGLQVVSSKAFTEALAAFPGGRVPANSRFQTDPIEIKGGLTALKKSLFTGASDTSAGAFVQTDYTGIVETLGRRDLTLRALISNRRTTSDNVEYVRQTSHTNNAATVAEATSSAAPTVVNVEGTPNVATVTRNAGGGYKPEGAWAYEKDTATVKTIAEWVPASKRSLADVAALEGLIEDELRADLAETEETEILNGSGSGEHLPGILNTSGIQAQAFDTDIFVTSRKGLTLARTVGRVRPNGIVLNPGDVETIDLAQDNNDRYYGLGPFSMGPRTLWGLPIVESEAIAEGTGLLGDFSKAVLWDREQTTVTVTDSHEDYFVRNLVAILAEERLAFAVTRPSAFVTLDLTA